MEEGNSATSVSKRPKFSRFTQQELRACKPLLTPGRVIAIFMIVGALFIPIGVLSLIASQNVVEIVDEYETECIPSDLRSDKVAYITNDTIPKNCFRILTVPKRMKPPIYVYYGLHNYYQNHRRSKNFKEFYNKNGRLEDMLMCSWLAYLEMFNPVLLKKVQS